jgi:hypothetical protein
MTRRAIPARRKGHGVARGVPKGRSLERRQQSPQEGSNGVRDRNFKEQLRLGNERATGNGIRGRSRRQQLRLESTGNADETFRETLQLEIAKRIAGTSIRLRKMSVRTLWRGRLPPKQKKSPLITD